MRFSILVFTLLIFSGCVSQATSVSENSKTAQPAPTIENTNAAANNRDLYTNYQYDSALIDKLNAENERFRSVPDEFKSVNFKNFKYDFGRLKNGELERNQTDNRIDGVFIYSFEDAFFIDLIGDNKKEAVVLIYRVGCGASCDGGADFVYFFSSNNEKARMIDILETGSNSGGCSLKSLTIKNKKLYVEQFGRCGEYSTFESRVPYVCKFCVKDETHSVYFIANKKLIRDSIEIIETGIINVMNSPAIISIIE